MEKLQIINGLKEKWIYSNNEKTIENLKNSLESRIFAKSFPLSITK